MELSPRQRMYQWQIDLWLKRQNEALNEAAFAERMIDRLMAEAGLDRPCEPPELYVIEGGRSGMA